MHITTKRSPGQKVYLANCRPARLSDILDRIRAAGFSLRTLPALLNRYLDYFFHTGYLNRPHRPTPAMKRDPR